MTTYEQAAREAGYEMIAGVDEAGRGPLAGPVVAAAVVFPSDYFNSAIRDSKKLSPGKRNELFESIHRDALAIGVRVVDVNIIDQINILRASLLAMREAVLELSVAPDFLLVDGNHRIPIMTPQQPIVKGDDASISIAAASIIAKVTRDRIMELYHRQFPQYNFRKNKGYGTREHLEAIGQFGPCKIHRRTFRIRHLHQVSFDFT